MKSENIQVILFFPIIIYDFIQLSMNDFLEEIKHFENLKF